MLATSNIATHVCVHTHTHTLIDTWTVFFLKSCWCALLHRSQFYVFPCWKAWEISPFFLPVSLRSSSSDDRAGMIEQRILDSNPILEAFGKKTTTSGSAWHYSITFFEYFFFIVIIIGNFYMALFSDLHKLTVLFNIFQHFQFWARKKIKGNTFKKVIHLSQLTILYTRKLMYVYVKGSNIQESK